MNLVQQTRKSRDEFVWNHIPSIDALESVRMSAMDEFLKDLETDHDRYVVGELPVLPFDDREFDIALCSHFLFLYSEHHAFDFHVKSIKELCRVALEARIFPLLELGSRKSRHLDGIIQELEKTGYKCSIREVSYEFQKGGNEMLQVEK